MGKINFCFSKILFSWLWLCEWIIADFWAPYMKLIFSHFNKSELEFYGKKLDWAQNDTNLIHYDNIKEEI